MENLTPYKELKTETTSDRVARVGGAVLDYLLDNCDRLGSSYFTVDLHFVPANGYNQNNWKADPNGVLVWFDNGKSMNCYGTKSLKEAQICRGVLGRMVSISFTLTCVRHCLISH